VNKSDSASQEDPSNITPANVLAGRRSSDQEHIDLYDRWFSLSTREQDVTYFACEGYTNREIAVKLGVAERTVKSYLEHVFFKMNVNSKVDLRLKFANFNFSKYYMG